MKTMFFFYCEHKIILKQECTYYCNLLYFLLIVLCFVNGQITMGIFHVVIFQRNGNKLTELFKKNPIVYITRERKRIGATF